MLQTPCASPAVGVGAGFPAEVDAPHGPSLGTAVDRATPSETIGPGEPAALLRLLLGDVALGPAQALLERFGSLRRLAAASAREVEREGGIAPETAARLAAAFQLGRLAHAERMRRDAPFRSSRDIFERFHPLLRDLKKERFLAVLVDGKNRVIREDRVSEGSLTSSLVHPREVFGPALREGAANILFVHNHPSGDPEPSPEDHDITARLCAVGELLGIRVLDHLVIGDGVYVSFLDRGWV
jgi:DNA repair protein RadC